MSEQTNQTKAADGQSLLTDGLGCKRLCIDFCNKYEEAQAETKRLRSILNRIVTRRSDGTVVISHDVVALQAASEL